MNQRRQEILNLIREDGRAKVQNLAKIFNVSEVTIRQDLIELEEMGLVQREHGGAYLKELETAQAGIVLNQGVHAEEKDEIARKAAALIKEGDTIILDSGSTCTALARLLKKYRELTVITNALNIAIILGGNQGIHVLVSGGEFKAPTISLTGDFAAGIFKTIHVSKCFLATAGISQEMQLTYPSLSDLPVKSAMIRAADKVFLLADSSKIGVSSLATLGRLSLIDTLITDSKISSEQLKAIKELNVEIL
jgi:DeoR/GlpR family transcriptional regulator of sugar metabolism